MEEIELVNKDFLEETFRKIQQLKGESSKTKFEKKDFDLGGIEDLQSKFVEEKECLKREVKEDAILGMQKEFFAMNLTIKILETALEVSNKEKLELQQKNYSKIEEHQILKQQNYSLQQKVKTFESLFQDWKEKQLKLQDLLQINSDLLMIYDTKCQKYDEKIEKLIQKIVEQNEKIIQMEDIKKKLLQEKDLLFDELKEKSFKIERMQEREEDYKTGKEELQKQTDDFKNLIIEYKNSMIQSKDELKKIENEIKILKQLPKEQPKNEKTIIVDSEKSNKHYETFSLLSEQKKVEKLELDLKNIHIKNQKKGNQEEEEEEEKEREIKILKEENQILKKVKDSNDEEIANLKFLLIEKDLNSSKDFKEQESFSFGTDESKEEIFFFGGDESFKEVKEINEESPKKMIEDFKCATCFKSIPTSILVLCSKCGKKIHLDCCQKKDQLYCRECQSLPRVQNVVSKRKNIKKLESLKK